MTNEHEIVSSRIISASIDKLYQAFADPEKLALWWGPKGFTNTIHAFDLRVGGKFELTMHGPDKGNYENASEFTKVIPLNIISWHRITQPWFDMEIIFQDIDGNSSSITFRMIFDSAESCEKLRRFVEPNNEENFDRLEAMLATSGL